MKTDLTDAFERTAEGELAEEIIRRCVHCGFCNATCPTYQLLGDENDGPRGRIYLIKQVLEGSEVTNKTRTHLDRCLTCRNCETTCPSGVDYSSLLEIGRHIVEEKTKSRPLKERFVQDALLNVLPYTKRFKFFLNIGRVFAPIFAKGAYKKIPSKVSKGKWSKQTHPRRMLILDGCVQPALSPDINSATARVLDKLKIQLVKIKKAGCCGAVSLHLHRKNDALSMMKHNIDAWWSEIEAGAEAIVTTASGCGVMIKDYGKYLENDVAYAEKAQRISSLCKDISEIIAAEDYLIFSPVPKTISWHPPCTLQHGQKLTGIVEKILTDCGYHLNPIKDSHLCCGSAGTYSILQADLSTQLGDNKIKNLEADQPEMIVTGNIGCQTHLQERTKTPVKHWVHLLLDE